MDNKMNNSYPNVTKTLDKYRDIFIANNVLKEKFIGFYNREFYCLDNFSSFIIEYNGKLYPTIEHAYQAIKFEKTSPETMEKIRTCLSAYDSKIIADENIEHIDPDWNNIKLKVMEKLLRTKLEMHPHVKDKLLRTKDCLICEDSPKDYYWGIGENGDGQNQLGKLWMKLRSELQNNKQ